jgi:DNA-binding HxlR family transcriptional regulator
VNKEDFVRLQRSFRVVGDYQTLKILYSLDVYGEQTFSQLRDRLRINPRTLSARLKVLVAMHFVVADRTRDGLRVFYSLDQHHKSISRILDAYERLAADL